MLKYQTEWTAYQILTRFGERIIQKKSKGLVGADATFSHDWSCYRYLSESERLATQGAGLCLCRFFLCLLDLDWTWCYSYRFPSEPDH